jgi:hypothetical protein
MAAMGKNESSFRKPYLEMIAEDILSKSPILMIDKKQIVVDKNDKQIRKFISVVKTKNDAQVQTVLRKASEYLPLFGGYKWTQIDKSPYSGLGGGKSDAKTTAMQERASLFAIKKSIENNGYSNQAQFYKLYREELRKIYPGMNEEWENGIFQQQLTTQKEVGNTTYRHYSRDDGFMDYISNMCKQLYGISQKDNWNPADIWLVSDYNKVKNILNSKIKDNSTSLQEFNAILRTMFERRQVIGISLKKISGKTARWELTNMDKGGIFEDGKYAYTYNNNSTNFFSLKNATEFHSSDTVLRLNGEKEQKIQIRQNSAGFNNLKIETTTVGAASARGGKAPLDMVSNIFRDYRLEPMRWRKNQNYPKTAKEFMAESRRHQDRYAQLLASNKLGVSRMGPVSKDKFVENMVLVFESNRPDVANSKLMQLDLCNIIFSLSDDKINNLLTDILFISQKKGDIFGPFAKLY